MIARCCICGRTLRLYNSNQKAKAQLQKHLNTHKNKSYIGSHNNNNFYRESIERSKPQNPSAKTEQKAYKRHIKRFNQTKV